jgi:apoptosis-inducing factor 2
MLSILRSFQYTVTVAFHLLTANYFRQQLSDPSLKSRTMKHIVIVGGSFAGVSSAHRILKQSAKTATGPCKVTLVSRDSHFYWNIAAPRGLLPEQIPDDKLFQPIAAGFAHYPAGQFEFVLGTATGIDVEAKQLKISGPAAKETKLDYDFLILGTGSNTKGDTPFKSIGSTESTKNALHEFQARVKNAKTIVVVGAGPTGVEISGELGFEYGKGKQIILVSWKIFMGPEASSQRFRRSQADPRSSGAPDAQQVYPRRPLNNSRLLM